MSRRIRFRFTLGTIALALAAACGGDTSTGSTTSSTPSTITASGGAGQSVATGVAASTPLTVKVVNASGTSLSGVTVTWAVASGGGSLSSASSSTDATGAASTTYTAGTTAGTATVTATVSGLTAATFAVTVRARTATTLSVVGGNNQSTTIGTALTTPFTVRVLDQTGAALSGVGVTFAVASGGGAVSTATATTDAGGNASTTYTAGTTAGTSTVTASVSGLTAVAFTTMVTTATSAGNAIAIASGGGQTITAGRAASSPFTVKVTNASGAAVSGATVTFAITAGGGSLSATTATTDANGNASTTYTAGSTAGAATVTASVAGGASVTFTSTITTGTAGSADSTTSKVIAAIDAFKATLSSTQIATFQIALTQTNASRWSNLPVSTQTPRNGVQLGALSGTQLTAALNVARTILSDTGVATFEGIRAADDYLRANGGGTAYGSGLYYLAVLGTPSTSSHWVLQLGGHHYALNAAFNGPATPKITVTGTPFFMGVEPIRFTLNGVSYAPMQSRQRTIYAMINALDATQKTTALLSGRFDDLLAGANGDGKFAATQQGIAGSALTAGQRTLVRDAINAWVQDLTPAAAAALMADYGADSSLTRTYISYATSTDSTVQGSYVRIDGPRVWVEFSVQRGAVFQNSIHYHAIWRDKARDYGGTISTAAIQQAAFQRQISAARYQFAERVVGLDDWLTGRSR